MLAAGLALGTQLPVNKINWQQVNELATANFSKPNSSDAATSVEQDRPADVVAAVATESTANQAQVAAEVTAKLPDVTKTTTNRKTTAPSTVTPKPLPNDLHRKPLVVPDALDDNTSGNLPDTSDVAEPADVDVAGEAPGEAPPTTRPIKTEAGENATPATGTEMPDEDNRSANVVPQPEITRSSLPSVSVLRGQSKTVASDQNPPPDEENQTTDSVSNSEPPLAVEARANSDEPNASDETDIVKNSSEATPAVPNATPSTDEDASIPGRASDESCGCDAGPKSKTPTNSTDCNCFQALRANYRRAGLFGHHMRIEYQSVTISQNCKLHGTPVSTKSTNCAGCQDDRQLPDDGGPLEPVPMSLEENVIDGARQAAQGLHELE